MLYTITAPAPGSPGGAPVPIVPVSATGSSAYPGYDASSAIDGNPLSDWASYHQGSASFLNLDLGASYSLTTALVTDRVTSGAGQGTFAGNLNDFTTSFSLTTYSDAAFTTATGTLTFNKAVPSLTTQVSHFRTTASVAGLTGRYIRYRVLGGLWGESGPFRHPF